MSGTQIGTVVGGVVGAFFGQPQLGMAIGGLIGGAVAPDHINGPKIGDGQQQTATDGAPIAWVQGTAMIAGTIVQVGPRRQIRHKDNGKGGPVTVTYTAVQDFAILICESSELRDSTMSSVLMVIQDGKIVYDVRPGSTMLASSYKWKANVDFVFGGEDQLPHPTLEAITGVGNTPAYRGSLTAVFKNFDVSAAGDRIPSFQFVVASSVSPPVTTLKDIAVDTGDADSGQGYAYSGYYDVGIPAGTSAKVTMAAVPVSQCQRYIIAPLLGVVTEGNTELNHDLRPTAAFSGSVFDTGWLAADASWLATAISPPPGSMDQPPASIQLYSDWQVGNPLPVTVLVPPGANGVRVYMQSWGPGASAPPAAFALSFTTQSADPIASNLGAIVHSVCKRGGLADGDVDVLALSGAGVFGYPIARQANAADCLLPLLQAYFGYASEYDAQLHFKFYGADADVTIDRADLIEGNDANDGAITSNLRNQSTEFPRRIVASYMDPAQNYTVVNVPAERLATDVIAIGDQSLQVPVVMSATDATQAANKALKVTYATLEGTQEYSTTFAGSDVYLKIAAGEAVIFQGKRWVADGMILGNGSLKLTTRYDRQSAYTSNVQPILGNAPTTPTSPYSGPTTMIPMNLPSQRPQDSVGVYLVAASTDGRDSWRGCNVQASYDGMETWQNALQINMEGTIGTIALNEPTGNEPLTVDVVKFDLDNATPAQLAALANAFAVVSTAGVTQLGQFGTATETATDKQYELTNVSRSLGGTAGTPVSAGDRFALMDAAYFLPIDPNFAGRTLYFRGVGYGEIAEDAEIYSLVYAALTQAAGQQITSESDVAMQSEDGLQLFNSET